MPFSSVYEVPEVREERHDFDRSAGLAGHKEEGSGRLDSVGNLPDPTGHCGVQHPELRGAFGGAECTTQDFGAETASAHAEQDHVGDASFPRRLREGSQIGQSILHLIKDCQPTEAVFDFRRGRFPYGVVSSPDPLDGVASGEVLECSGDGLVGRS